MSMVRLESSQILCPVRSYSSIFFPNIQGLILWLVLMTNVIDYVVHLVPIPKANTFEPYQTSEQGLLVILDTKYNT